MPKICTYFSDIFYGQDPQLVFAKVDFYFSGAGFILRVSDLCAHMP